MLLNYGGYITWTGSDWSGYASTSSEGNVIVTNEAYNLLQAGSPLPLQGAIAADRNYNNLMEISINIQQRPDSSLSSMILQGSGIYVNIDNPDRIILLIGFRDVNGTLYGYQTSDSGVIQIPYDELNTQPWPGGDGEDFISETMMMRSVNIVVLSDTQEAIFVNLTLKDIYEY